LQALQVQPDVIRFTRPQMAVTLNGIAQGFAADVVRARWQAMGVQHGLINTGEWSALGLAQGGKPWRLGIADPRDEDQLIQAVAFSGQSVATSADNQTFFSPDFKHHHIFDPHTGHSPAAVASVTVLASSAALADALTKVIFVAGKALALQTAKAWRVEVLLVDKAGQRLASPGLIGL
jgi:thiamine biosynthesis lipoprotein